MLRTRRRQLLTKRRHRTKRPILQRLATRPWPVTKQALPMKAAAMKAAATSRVQ